MQYMRRSAIPVPFLMNSFFVYDSRFQLPARPFFVVLAWSDASRVSHHAIYRLPGDETCAFADASIIFIPSLVHFVPAHHSLPHPFCLIGSFLCAIENSSGRAGGVSLSLVPQMSPEGAVGMTTVLAGNVECESLFLISRGSGPPQSLSNSAAARTPEAYHVEPPGSEAAAAHPKVFAAASTSSAVPTSAWSQSSYGSKVRHSPLPGPLWSVFS